MIHLVNKLAKKTTPKKKRRLESKRLFFPVPSFPRAPLKSLLATYTPTHHTPSVIGAALALVQQRHQQRQQRVSHCSAEIQKQIRRCVKGVYDISSLDYCAARCAMVKTHTTHSSRQQSVLYAQRANAAHETEARGNRRVAVVAVCVNVSSVPRESSFFMSAGPRVCYCSAIIC